MKAIRTDRASDSANICLTTVHRFKSFALRWLYINTVCTAPVRTGLVLLLFAHLFGEESS